ncbi:HET-domain-containing protein, partial [Clathrospora elynae]
KSWLSACEECHSRCGQSSQYTPSRLLDIMLDDPETVKLVELHPGPGAAPRYACLSHCWGQTRSKHITRVSTLANNLHGIPVSELPKTFQEAIDIARALEIRYLWID